MLPEEVKNSDDIPILKKGGNRLVKWITKILRTLILHLKVKTLNLITVDPEGLKNFRVFEVLKSNQYIPVPS